MKRRLMIVVALLTSVVLVTAVTSAVASPPKPPELRGKTSALAPPLERQAKPQSVYVPISPCRIVDTRGAAAGKFAPNTTRTFRVRGTSSFPTQGGTSGGCGVPETATGVTVNTTMTAITGGGYLTNFPAGGTAATTNFTTFAAGQSLTSNPTFALAASGTEPSLAIKSSGGANLHLIIDVTGYYAPQVQGMIGPDGGLYSGSPALISSSRSSAGVYVLEVDRDVTYCAVSAQPYNAVYEGHATGFNGNLIYVYVFTRSGNTQSYADDYVYVTATC